MLEPSFIMGKHHDAFAAFPPHVQDDKCFVLRIVQRCGALLRYASHRLRDDVEIVKAALQNCSFAMESASERLQGSEDMFWTAWDLCKDVDFFSGLSSAHRGDKKKVLLVVKRSGDQLYHASSALKDDKDVVLAAVHQYASAMQFVSERLRCDPDVIEAAISRKVLFYMLPLACRADRTIGLKGVKEDGLNLALLDPSLQGDEEIAIAAVKENCLAISWAPSILRESKSFMKAVVTGNGGLIRFANAALKDDKELALLAVKQTEVALRDLSLRLRGDDTIVRAAMEKYAARARDAPGEDSVDADSLTEWASAAEHPTPLTMASAALQEKAHLRLLATEGHVDAYRQTIQFLARRSRGLESDAEMDRFVAALALVSKRSPRLAPMAEHLAAWEYSPCRSGGKRSRDAFENDFGG